MYLPYSHALLTLCSPLVASGQDEQATPSQEGHAELSGRPDDFADTSSQHLGIQVPHWGAALDVTKMALEETAEEEEQEVEEVRGGEDD